MATFEQCQREYDNMSPPEDHDCEEEGHEWKFVRSDGDNSLYRCKICREEVLN